MSRKIKLYIAIPGIILLGFIRDYFFININWIYLTLTGERRNQARPEFNSLLEWLPGEILSLKWILTILFYLLFLGMTLLIIHIGFKKRAYNITTLLMFAGLFIVSGILFVFGWLTGFGQELYGAIHTIMMLAQSFIPLMILSIIFKFLPNTEKE